LNRAPPADVERTPIERPDNTIVGHVRNGFLARMMRFKPYSIVVWLALANRADRSGCCWPSITTIQGDTGLGRPTVYRALRELVAAGEITVESGGAKRNQTNCYRFPTSSPGELVPDGNQFPTETKVVPHRDTASSPREHKPNNRTKHKNQTACASARFVPPSISEVQNYCRERNNHVDCQRFLDYYESNGWRVGRNAMKDWRAAVRTWERNGFENGNGAATKAAAPVKYRDEVPR